MREIISGKTISNIDVTADSNIPIRQFFADQYRVWLTYLIFLFLPLDLLFRIDSLAAALTTRELLATIAGAILMLAVLLVPAITAITTAASLFRIFFKRNIFKALATTTSFTLFFLGCYLFSRSFKLWAKSLHIFYQGSVFFWACILFGVALAVWRSSMAIRIDAFLSALRKPLYAIVCMAAVIVAGHISVAELNRPTRPTAAQTSNNAAPNIILVTFDALTTDDMSLYGYHLPTTPHLERFARQSTLYERAYAVSNTTPFAVSSLMTGAYPGAGAGITFFSPYVRIPAAISDTSIPALLQKSGYHTYAVVPMTDLAHPSALGLSRHFNDSPLGIMEWSKVPLFFWPGRISQAIRCFGGLFMAEQYGIFSGVWLSEYLLENLDTYGRLATEKVSSPFSTPEAAVSKSIQLLSRHRQQHGAAPFFLWLHFFQPHTPYLPGEGFRGLFLKNDNIFSTVRSIKAVPSEYAPAKQPQIDQIRLRYDETIAYADAGFGSLVRELQKLDLLDSSLMIVSADHGESFTNGFFGHLGTRLSEPIIKIPLLLKRPGQDSAAHTGSLVSSIDIPATILDAAGIKAHEKLTGNSLLKQDFKRNEAICLVPDSKKHSSGIHMAALLRPPYKLVYDAVEQKSFLYHFEHDPDERNDIAEVNHLIHNRMLAELLKKVEISKALSP
jgi:arylsulfatase A-like enzyme